MDHLTHSKNKIKILILENVHTSAIDVFKHHGYTNIKFHNQSLDPDEIISEMEGVAVLGIRSATHLDKKILDQASNLLTIGCFCIGTDQVDLKAASLKGIPVFNDPHSNTRSVAELVIGLCIALLRDIFPKSIAAHLGQWNKITEGSHEIRGKTLGIVGYGRIGSQISTLAESLGMLVIYYDIDKKLSLGNAKPIHSLEDLISLSDIVTLHVPETKKTLNLMNKDRLMLMKKTAFLINTSRGKVVDIDALTELLKHKKIRGAAIDVFPEEPGNNSAPFISPLQQFQNVIITPHIGGATLEAQEQIGIMVAQKIIHFIERGSTEGSTNFPQITLSPHENAHRILHVHENIPGMLSQINKVFADKNINILSQYLQTNGEIGYVVFDVAKSYKDNLINTLQEIKGTIRARILY